MSQLLPGNIVYGGDLEVHESNSYRSLGQFVLEKLRSAGDNITLIDAEKEVEYNAGQIYNDVIRLAQVLRLLGVQQGDVVALSSENRLEFAITTFATLALNATVAPLNITYTDREVNHAFNLSKPKVVFASKYTIDQVASVAKNNNFVKTIISFDETKPPKHNNIYSYKDLRENRSKFPSNPTFESPAAQDKNDDVAIIVCSSGTTGMPKGVQLTQTNVMRTLDYQIARNVLFDGAVILSVIPWFHAFGCFTLLTASVLGAKLVFLPKFEEKLFLHAIQKYQVMVAFMVPPLMVFLAKHPLVDKYDLSSLLALLCGAAPLSKDTEDQVRNRIGVPIIRQGYGLSESTLSVLVQNEECCTPGSVGALNTGVYAKVLDPDTGKLLGPNQPGELCFKGDCIMKGYIGDVKATQSTIIDGWLHTGDVGYYTEQLEFFIVDRIKELIKYKAFQVPPAELEALLLTNPAVSDAAVIGRPDEEAGELPMAFIVPQPGAKLTEEEVVKFVQDRASPAKRLRGGVVFVKEIPKNPSGKILRRVLRDTIKQQKPKSKL